MTAREFSSVRKRKNHVTPLVEVGVLLLELLPFVVLELVPQISDAVRFWGLFVSFSLFPITLTFIASDRFDAFRFSRNGTLIHQIMSIVIVFLICGSFGVGAWAAAVKLTTLPLVKSPEFKFGSFPVNVGESPLSAEDIKNMRRYELSIHNPNGIPLDSVELHLQFPEEILGIKSIETAPDYQLTAVPAWHPQPVTISIPENIKPPNATIQPIGDEQKTGLWNIVVKHIPARGNVKLELLSTIERKDQIYNSATRSAITINGMHNAPMWLMYGFYSINHADETINYEITIPLRFVPVTRVIEAEPAIEGSISEFKYFKILQGKGVRLTGVFGAPGWLLVYSSKQPDWAAASCHFYFESQVKKGSNFMFYVRMPEMEPMITYTDGAPTPQSGTSGKDEP